MSMPMPKILLSTIFLSCFPLSAYATVGGPQHIEVLGLDRKAQKIYLMRHFEDGRGRLPQLYYYQLNGTNPTKLIQVDSLYINPKTKLIDYDQNSTQFDIEIAKIQKRLLHFSLYIRVRLIFNYYLLKKERQKHGMILKYLLINGHINIRLKAFA